MSKKFKSRKFRSSKGSGLVASVVGVVLLVAMAVCAVFFVLNVGTAFYYREKVDFVNNQAAHWAVAARYWDLQNVDSLDTVQQHTVSVANNLLTKMGMPSVTSLQVSDNGEGTIKVDMNVEGLSLPGKNSIFPASVNLQDSVAIRSKQAPGYVYLIAGDGDNKKMVSIPAYGLNNQNGTPSPANSDLLNKLPGVPLTYNAYSIGTPVPAYWQEGFGVETATPPSVMQAEAWVNEMK